MPAEELIILALAAINFTHILDFVIMMPLGPQLMSHFHINAQSFSFVVASYTFAAGFSGLIGAYFLDRYDRKSALLYCYAGFIVGTAACALAPTYAFLVMARIFAGLFGGLVGTLVFSIVGDLIPHERRGFAMGKISAAFSVASVVGVPIGLYFSQLFNWHFAFWFISLMGVIFWILAFRILPPIRFHLEKEDPNPFDAFLRVLRYPNHWRAFAFIFCLTLAGFTVIPFLMPYLASNLRFDSKLVPWAYFFGGLATFFTSPLIGRFSDKVGKHKVFKLTAALSILPIVYMTQIKSGSNVEIILLMVLFTVLVSGRFVPAIALASAATLPAMRGAFMSLYTSVLQIGSGIASLIGGYLIVTQADGTLIGYSKVGYVAAAFSVIAIFLSGFVKNQEAQSSKS